MKILRNLAFLGAAIAWELHAQQPRLAPLTQADVDELAAARIPAGTNVTEADVSKLAGDGFNGQVLYLVGTFVVTARGGDRVVLRFDGKPKGPRIVAVYPPAIPTSAEGAKLVRGDTQDRAYLITEVRQSRNGQINIRVCDITHP